MKIIFSRKGFDAKNGGVASPIFHDGRMYSLPIPSPDSEAGNVRYREIKFDQSNLGRIVADLTKRRAKRHTGNSRAHLDPDLNGSALARRSGWLPAFGQANAARAHLEENGVGGGDLFLFFGWFRRVEEIEGHLRFVRGEPDIHLLWGWLQVGEVYQECSRRSKLPLWASFHPHVYEGDEWRAEGENYDTLYVAKKRLDLPGLRLRIPGGGIFKKYHRKLQLTEPGNGRRVWRVPAWMYPFPNKPPLTYHPDKKRWTKVGGKVLLRTVDIGQEFVLDGEYYPQALKWLANLFRAAAWMPVAGRGKQA